jgi:hypothetical protein
MSRARTALVASAVFSVACIYSWLGAFTTYEWIDEGQIVYPGWRVAMGAIPYRDYLHAYGPSLFFLNGALLALFGTDLAVIRVSLAVLAGALSLGLFLACQRLAGGMIALLVTVGFILVWGSPIWVFHTAYASHYTIVCGMWALVVLLGGPPTVRRCLVAGLLIGVGASFKQTTGLLLGMAAAVPLMSTTGAPAASRAVRLLAIAFAALAWLLLVTFAVGRHVGLATMALVIPAAAGAALMAVVALRDEHFAPPIAALVALALGAALPLGAWTAFFVGLGALRVFVQDLIVFPQRLEWFDPLQVPVAVVSGTVVTACGVFVMCRRLHGLRPWAGTLATSVALLVPVVASGGGAFVGLSWVPVIAAYASIAALVGGHWQGARVERARALALSYAMWALPSLFPSADFAHALMTLPLSLPALVSLAPSGEPRVAGRLPGRTIAAVAAVVVTLALVGPYVATFGFSTTGPVSAGPGLARATGVTSTAPRFRAMAQVVQAVEARAPAGAPLLVLPSEQGLYVLANRVSVFDAEELVLYLVAHGLLSKHDADEFTDEAAMLARLRTARPLLVRIDAPKEDARFAASFPSLAAFIDERYEEVERFGPYRILALRESLEPTSSAETVGRLSRRKTVR